MRREREDVVAAIETDLAARTSQVFVSIYGAYEADDGDLIVNLEGTLSAADLRAVAAALDRGSANPLRRLRGWLGL